MLANGVWHTVSAVRALDAVRIFHHGLERRPLKTHLRSWAVLPIDSLITGLGLTMP